MAKRSKKVLTITCHDVYNFGASLQAYALMKYLQGAGHNVKIIDYKPPYMQYKLWAIGVRWKRNIALRLIFYLYVIPVRIRLRKRRQLFDEFTRSFLSLTLNKYGSNNELKADPPEADVYFAGSDQIWNILHPHGKDPAFYLDFVPKNATRASYAASFSVSEIPGEYHEFVKSKLLKFDSISVREKSGLDILKSLRIKGILVMDPVFLIDKIKWNSLAVKTSNEKYLVIYDQENNKLIKNAAKWIAARRNCKIYAIQSLYPMNFAHKRLFNVGPREFLGLIRDCEVCLTNSFHATAFSLIFKKDFITFKRTHEKVNSRMIDLLGMLGLEDRIYKGPESLNSINSIDYRVVEDIINKKISASKAYIGSVMDLTGKDD